MKKLHNEITRNLPQNLQPNDRYLFQQELKRKFKQSIILILNFFTIDGNGTWIVFRKNKNEIKEKQAIYQLSFFQYFKFFVIQIIRKRVVVIFRKYVWFVDTWSNGYFHWLFDALPRLHQAQKKYSGLNIILPDNFKEQEYMLASLATLGFSKVKFMNKNKIYLFSKLIFQTHLAPTGNYLPENILSLKKQILKNIDTSSCHKGKKIYISRKKSARRKILNENELIPVLKKFNFEIIYFEDYAWGQQVAIAANAEIMVGLHGAGLGNMLFMPDKSTILELRKQDDTHNNCYFSLASALGHEYFYLQCNTNEKDMWDADFFVDKNKFEQILIQIS